MNTSYRGKALMEINKLSTNAFINQGVFEMKKKLYDKAVNNFSLAINESHDLLLPFVMRSKCFTL